MIEDWEEIQVGMVIDLEEDGRRGLGTVVWTNPSAHRIIVEVDKDARGREWGHRGTRAWGYPPQEDKRYWQMSRGTIYSILGKDEGGRGKVTRSRRQAVLSRLETE